MSGLRALAYADVRSAINAVRGVRKHPWRALMWAAYIAVIVAFALLKTSPRTRAPRMPVFELVLSDVWICGIAVAFGILLATGYSRWLGVFSSRAEALLLTRSDSPPSLVAAYLQLRTVLAALGQTALRFAYIIVVGIPGGTTVPALAAQLCFFAASGAAIVSVALPRSLLRGRAKTTATVLGWTVVVAAALPVVLDALRVLKPPLAAPLLHAIPAWHPGVVLTQLAAGDMRAVFVPLVLAAVVTAAFVVAARDAYPELYAISLANLEWRAKRQARRAGGRTAVEGAQRAATAPSTTETRWRGALAFVWTDALMFSRRISPAVTAAVVAGALVAGAGLAAVTRATDESLLIGIVLGIVPTFYIAIASTTGVRLAPALRLPLFWLGDVALVMRLAAWTLGPMLRDLALLVLALAGYLAVDRRPLVPVLVLVSGIGLLALTRAVGIAVFALLPNALDQRGPAVVIRILIALVLVAPAVAGGMLVGFLLGSPTAGALAGTVLAFAESSVLLGFAAWRLAGRVDALSTA